MTTTHEITVTARNADGDEHTIHAEYKAQSSEPKGAASEILEATQKAMGKDRVTYIDTDR